MAAVVLSFLVLVIVFRLFEEHKILKMFVSIENAP